EGGESLRGSSLGRGGLGGSGLGRGGGLGGSSLGRGGLGSGLRRLLLGLLGLFLRGVLLLFLLLVLLVFLLVTSRGGEGKSREGGDQNGAVELHLGVSPCVSFESVGGPGLVQCVGPFTRPSGA